MNRRLLTVAAAAAVLLGACGEPGGTAPDSRIVRDDATVGGGNVTDDSQTGATTAEGAGPVADDSTSEGFHPMQWLRGWLSDDGTVLTVEYGSHNCYRTEQRISASEVGGKVAVLVENRLLEEPPITCLPVALLKEADVVLPRAATPGEIIDATCPTPIHPPPQTTQMPAGTTTPPSPDPPRTTSSPTAPQETAPVTPSVSGSAAASLPPLEPTSPSAATTTPPGDCHVRPVEIGLPPSRRTVSSTLPPLTDEPGPLRLANLVRASAFVGRDAEVRPAERVDGMVYEEAIEAAFHSSSTTAAPYDLFYAEYVDHQDPDLSRLAWIVIDHDVSVSTVAGPMATTVDLGTTVHVFDAFSAEPVVSFTVTGPDALTDPSAVT